MSMNNQHRNKRSIKPIIFLLHDNDKKIYVDTRNIYYIGLLKELWIEIINHQERKVSKHIDTRETVTVLWRASP